ncbi:hypothetical protein VDG1235_422 [Verrucomicrobiia bacterium DG1235]|nr:hypothetical protein VDG1235_422 [Verrucomicrobiae bacterium DG1235]
MDQINSNPFFNAARLYQNQQAPQKTGNPVDAASKAAEIRPAAIEQPVANDFSTMFDDDSLLKLQSNLEAIAQMAEQSLKQIDS